MPLGEVLKAFFQAFWKWGKSAERAVATASVVGERDRALFRGIALILLGLLIQLIGGIGEVIKPFEGRAETHQATETTVYLITYGITALAAIALIGISVFVTQRKDSSRTAITAALSFAFLILILLNVSKFKHVKSFGFEADTWDEQQVKAAELIDKLSNTSEVVNEQIALLASRLGLRGPGLTNPELDELLQHMKLQLRAVSTSNARIDELTSPIKRRIAMNYWSKAQSNLDALYTKQSSDMQKEGETEQASELLREKEIIDAEPSETPRDLGALIALVKGSKVFKAAPDLLQELDDLDKDLRFFWASSDNELRRKINLDEAYPWPNPSR